MRPSSVTGTPDEEITFSIIVRREWSFLVGGAAFLYVFVCTYMSGWKASVTPDLATPYGYSGDLIFHSWMIRRVMEGWLFDNPRSGYPFGSNFLDYPGSDLGNHLILKLFGFLGGNFYAAINLYFVAGFIVTYGVSYLVLRKLAVSSWFSLAGAIIFTATPFHFLRLPHLFYTWYFVIPIYYILGFSAFYSPTLTSRRQFFRLSFACLLILSSASFGVYYALFGAIVFIVCGIAGLIHQQRWSPLVTCAIFGFALTIGVLLNIAPNLHYRATNGPNPEVTQRSPEGAEIYGLKFIQLILPQQGHRIPQLSTVSDNYSDSFPLVNENRSAALGAVGSIGLALVIGIIAIRLSGREVDLRLSLLSLIVATLFMFGTIGGFGTIFALTISPMIRGWNRISVFIAFGTITCFFIVLQCVINRFLPKRYTGKINVCTAVVLVVVALFDQVPPRTLAGINYIKERFSADRAFIAGIEAQMSAGSAIYQMPYIAFPEAPLLHEMNPYDPLIGYLHSNTLRWSSGGMKGRPGDLLFRALANEPAEKQLQVIKRLGFSGLYIDKRGYEDSGKQIMGELTALIGHPPTLESADGRVAFFKLPDTKAATFEGLSPFEIMEKGGYIADEYGVRYDSLLENGVDFSKSRLPSFLSGVRGLSQAEPWGRWSDGNLAPVVRFDFNIDLPENFVLVADVIVFGPNAGAPLVIQVGEQKYQTVLPAGEGVIQIPVHGGVGVRSIEFTPPKPTIARLISDGSDNRKLGIGFKRMDFERR